MRCKRMSSYFNAYTLHFTCASRRQAYRGQSFFADIVPIQLRDINHAYVLRDFELSSIPAVSKYFASTAGIPDRLTGQNIVHVWATRSSHHLCTLKCKLVTDCQVRITPSLTALPSFTIKPSGPVQSPCGYYR